jgi:hypothetical protein
MKRAKRRLEPPSRHFLDVFWCYARIDDPLAKPEHASSAGAWELLLWARANLDRFYESVFPRALKAEAKAEAEYQEQLQAEETTRDDILEYLRNYDMVKDLMRMEGVTTALIADVETLVDEWSRQTGIGLTEEGWVALVSQIATGVHHAIEAAYFDPDAIADDAAVIADAE